MKNFLSANLPAGQRLSQGNTPSPAGNTKITRTLSTPHILQAYRKNVKKETISFCSCKISYPCCVLPEVTTFVFYTVGVADPLQELHLLYDVLPFLLETGTVFYWAFCTVQIAGYMFRQCCLERYKYGRSVSQNLPSVQS